LIVLDASTATSVPSSSPTKTPSRIPKTLAEEPAESPTHASKVLPKVEPSLGAGEAGQAAAEMEAADRRPTFYENVVEGAVKRKKTQGPVASQLATPTLFNKVLPSV